MLPRITPRDSNLKMLEINHAMPINYNVLPETIDAVHHFEACGGHLMLFSPFGLDPLSARPYLSTQRERVFFDHYPSFAPFFHHLVNSDTSLFCTGIQLFIYVSKSLASLI